MESYKKYEDDLRAEYYHTFKEVEVYFKTSELSDKEMEDVMNNILDLFLTAQSEGKPLKDVIGQDTQLFCESYLKTIWKFPNIKIFMRYFGACLIGDFMGIIFCLIMDYFNGEINNIWAEKTNISAILLFCIPTSIGVLIDQCIIKKKVFKNCINRENYIERKGWIAVMILVILLQWVCERFDIKIYASLAQIVFIAIVVLIIYVIINLVYEASSRYQIRKRRN
ncbi:MAG: DUF1048 domain-containing protein [Inconstantimicrobium porci]|uniref:DUF1048 domain-containing protein n=1 Tax=Inconstantimicrobium porci TaxID=2652291 RepID=UPI002409F151|nr:DUF1048 domain-containing protein [Inconstantimicrobium porci]MDD6771772.1 DUF1048 domain-containing protein [Inconstantimicrobium porci]MDY5910421.1 DUF1048 domain-containing protein [Inconstantimicrobium porci]